MAEDWSGRKDRPEGAGEADPVDDDLATHSDTGPASGAAALEGDDKPEDDVDSRESGAPPLTDRMAAAARRVGAGALARLPAVRAAMLPRLTRLVCAIAGGVLLFTSFPSLNWWWGAVVAAALLAWVLKHPATTPAGGLGYGFLFGLAFYLPLLPWISMLVGAVPWMVLAMTCALFPALFGLGAVLVRQLPGWPVWFALVWTAQEWLKSIVPFGGFPWGSVAFGQAQGPFLPLVQLGGAALLSTAIVLVGFSATAIELEIVKWWLAGKRAQRGADESANADAEPPAVVLPGVCICLVLFASVVVWPQVRHAGTGSGGEPSVTVAVVQGNVPRLGLDFNAQRRAVLDNHVRETLRLAEDVRAGHAPQPQFVIWPEDSSDIDPLVNVDAALEISQAATAVGAPILIGTVSELPGSPPENPQYTNTMIVWNPSTGPADRHDKEIVQPFGEYLPMPWLFSHLSSYANRAGNMVPRPGTDVVHIAGVPVGVATCWEVIFNRVPRKAVLNGAQLLAVPSNNATFNKTMSEQQLGFAKVRAVEHDRYVVVAGTTGISAVIAPDGAELVRTDFFQPDYLDIQVRLKTKLTPATRWGPILQWLLVAAAGAAILAGIRHNRWFPRPIRRRSEAPDESPNAGTPPGEIPPDEDGDQAPPEDGGDYTPLHEGGQRPSRHIRRHRGAT
ncbi:apolipoprotein N-acyltransferase [Mycobacterium sp. 852014-50255_SCH5639931]|nr:apolipoprotein N-acyltransferase [Mycobacterium sp. 852014-50255_SCH5639931]